jgi:hypothetical protein
LVDGGHKTTSETRCGNQARQPCVAPGAGEILKLVEARGGLARAYGRANAGHSTATGATGSRIGTTANGCGLAFAAGSVIEEGDAVACAFPGARRRPECTAPQRVATALIKMRWCDIDKLSQPM